MASNDQSENRLRRDAAVALCALAEPGVPLEGECPTLEQISAWHDNGLPDDEASLVKTHVARCDQCFDLWNGMVDALDESTASVDVRIRGRSKTWTRPLLALAATLLGLALLMPVLINRAPGNLPAYEIRINQSATVRGEDPVARARRVSLSRGDRFELILIPTSKVTGTVDAQAFVLVADSWQELDAPPTLNQTQGVLEISGVVGSTVMFPLELNELLIAIGRRGHLPDSRTMDRMLGDRSVIETPQWSAWRITVVVAPPD